MASLSSFSLPPPKAWDNLEILVWDLLRREWNDPYTVRHGRTGQRQSGVDIYGRPDMGDSLAGAQVKGRSSSYGSPITEDELRAAVQEAKGFHPPLSQLVLVTSAPRDASIQQVAREISEQNTAEGLFSVEAWSWQDVEERLASHPELVRLYYPQFFEMQGDGQIAEVLREMSQTRREELAAAQERDRPRFVLEGAGTTTKATIFTPQFKCTHIGGESIPSIEWRFRGPRFHMDSSTIQAAILPRYTMSEVFDLTGPPGHDDILEVNELGVEITFVWRDKKRIEIHRFPLKPSGPRGDHWDIGRENQKVLFLTED